MKKTMILLGMMFVLALSACNDWLDVRPRTEMKEDDLYAVEEGFKNALTGAYIQLASKELYGQYASMDIPEFLAQHWTVSTSKTTYEYNIGNYNYTHSEVEPRIEKMWKKYFQCVVHLNNVLYNLKNSSVVFSWHNDKLIEGEALGLRALVHLEVLRMFGPVPVTANDGDKAVPYVEEMTKEPVKLVSRTYGEVKERIIRDLDAAEKLLLEVDPILPGSNKLLNNPNYKWEKYPEDRPEDEWQFYRQVRFNYYAVLGAKARYYHWIGDKENAVKYARMVIGAKNKEDDTPKFKLADEAYYSGNGDLVMFCEHLFGVSNPGHQSIVQSLFKDESASLTQQVSSLNTAYEKTVHPDDIRYKGIRYWEERTYQHSSKTNHFRKYTGNDDFAPKNIIPVLRLAEMYLILIEDLPLEEAKGYFRTYRISRSLNQSVENELTSESAVLTQLEKEYRKEFFGEGQMFFFYKRHNYSALTWPKKLTLPAEVYRIPLPKSQSAFD